MKARFIIRLMSATDVLLAWTEVWAEARPQGRPRSTPFFAIGQTLFVVDESGLASSVIIHWPELDLVRRMPIGDTQVEVGQSFTFTWIGPVWMVKGADAEIPLPPVTVRQRVTIAPPTGNLAAASQI